MVAPASSRSSYLPSSIRFATNASQLPSGDVGDPLKLQPHPGSQLQNSTYVPRRFQLIVPPSPWALPRPGAGSRGSVDRAPCPLGRSRLRERPLHQPPDERVEDVVRAAVDAR